MKRLIVSTMILCLTMGASGLLAASSSQISGDYLEARSADVYTGFCVANSEVNTDEDRAAFVDALRESL